MGSCQGGQCGSKAESAPSEEDVRLQENLKRIQNKLLVMSGKGGVGKSSVAVHLALGLAKLGHKVGLLDVDLHGPSVPRMLGISGMFEVGENKCLTPRSHGSNLGVVSIECLLENKDSAVIWRGPVKHGVIKQFISEVNWGDLDYLIIDSPPGTGDEPLSVAQTVPDAHAVIVTTPQEVALADVRKSINFCRQVNMPIMGLVENMSGLVCPHCNKEIPLFSKGGGQKTATAMDVYYLGSLPLDPRVVEACDNGKSVLDDAADSPFSVALMKLVGEVVKQTGNGSGAKPAQASLKVAAPVAGDKFKIAVPLAEGVLTNHFGHCEQFAIMEVENGVVKSKEIIVPPPHEPGLLPKWLGERSVNLIIAGGMGQRALELFGAQNIKVVTGAPNLAPEALVEKYFQGALVTGDNVCDH